MRANYPKGSMVCALAILLLLGANLPIGRAQATTEGGQPEPRSRFAEIPRSSAAPRTVPGGAAGIGVKATLGDFAWLEGKWQGLWGPRIAEQVWMAPRGGEMLGLSRVAENDKTLVIELFSLAETPNGIELRFRHFTPSLTMWEKSDFAELKIASLDPKMIVFENPAGGQPKRQTFIRVDAENYISRSEIVSDSENKQVTEIRYHRQK
jgi:uncharacterized protein DUF6265